MLRRKNSRWRRTVFTCTALTLGASVLLTSENLAADLPAEVIAAAIIDVSRPSTDTVRDVNRKPAEMLQFSGLKRGDKVADYAAGAGYFTRLFAAVVGPNGHVYASVPSALFKYPNIVKGIAEIETYAFTHANVTVSLAAALDAAKYPEKLDVFWISQNYHDLHDRFMGPVDMAAFNRTVYAALKPGGTYLVLDHVAAAGCVPAAAHRGTAGPGLCPRRPLPVQDSVSAREPRSGPPPEQGEAGNRLRVLPGPGEADEPPGRRALRR